MRTIVYIDGFNFFYGAVKGTPYKWLDLSALCRQLLPKNNILSIKYFTANVNVRASDPDQPIRQQTYFRALRTIPNLEIILGHFLTSETTMRLVNPPPGQSPYVKVIKTEEKGSDVNMATHLLCDGYENAYDVAVVITNDSDLLEPIRVVREKLNRTVGILNPHKYPSQVLKQYASFIKPIRQGVVAASQFPDTMTDQTGAFTKPATW